MGNKLSSNKHFMIMVSNELTFSGIKVLERFLHDGSIYCISCEHNDIRYTISINEDNLNLKYDLNNSRQSLDFQSISLLTEYIKEVK